MLYKNILIKAYVQELEEQLAEITKRKGRKRKQIQHSRTIEYGAAVLSVAKSATAACTVLKRARVSSSQERGQPG
jgi:hypothetical protein